MQCSRDKEMWTKLKYPDIPTDRYLISTNGRVKDLVTKSEVKHIRRHTAITTFVGLYRTDGSYCAMYNLQRLMIYSFTKLRLSPAIRFYFKNGDTTDLFIGNIGIRKPSATDVTPDIKHEICKLMERKIPIEDIVHEYRSIDPTIVRNAISLMAVGYYASVSSQYDIDMDLYNRIK